MGSVEPEIVGPAEGFSWATKSIFVLLLLGFFLPALLTFLNLFSSESDLSTLSESFFWLFGRSLIWGAVMAALSAGLSIALALPPALFLSFSPLGKNRGILKLLRLSGILLFVLPSSAVALGILSLLPEKAPLFIQRGIFPVVLAHLFWNHLLLVDVFQNKLQSWKQDSGQRQIEGARTLGASPGQILRKILLPALAPEISFFGGVLFLWSLTAFGTVLILGGGAGASSLETLSFYHLFGSFDPARLGFLLPVTFVINLGFFNFLARFLKQSSDLGSSSAITPPKSPEVGPALFSKLCGSLLFTILVFALGLGLLAQSINGSGTLILSFNDAEIWGALGRSLIIGVISAAAMLALSLLSVFSDSRSHRVAFAAIGISPALLSVAYSHVLGNSIHEWPFYLQLSFVGFVIAFSLWPLADYWIARRKSQITPEILEAAAALGASLKLRVLKVRLPYLRDIVSGCCLFAALAGFSDLLFSALFLDGWKTLALLSEERAARYDFHATHLFLLSTWVLAAILILFKNPLRKGSRPAC